MKYICVFCGSSQNAPETHKEAAKQLGKAIVDAGYGLVYGGANVGLMGILADSVLQANGSVIGVITPEVKALEVVHQTVIIRETKNYSERKKVMRDLSAGFVALPGGLGTIDEFFEVMITNQFASYENTPENPVKPVALFNIDGFFDGIAGLIAQSEACSYLKSTHVNMLLYSDNPLEITQHIASFKGPEANPERWWEAIKAQGNAYSPAFDALTVITTPEEKLTQNAPTKTDLNILSPTP